MKVIIFGGTGWLGHNIVSEFTKTNHELTICCRGQKKTFQHDLPDNINIINADKQNPSQMAKVFADKYDLVIDTVPSETTIDNIIKYARSIKQYIHCSSTGGYAPLPFIPGDETCPYDHFMGGWKTKGIVDAKVMNAFHTTGFPATILRPSYITGPGMLPLDNFGGRRTDFLQDILDETTLLLPNDGQPLLHPVHIKDLANAFLLAANQPRSIGQIYNISLPKAVTLNQYLNITANALDRKINIEYANVDNIWEKYSDKIDKTGLYFLATHMCYDITKATTQLGYRPHCTTQQAIEETAQWNVKNTNQAT